MPAIKTISSILTLMQGELATVRAALDATIPVVKCQVDQWPADHLAHAVEHALGEIEAAVLELANLTDDIDAVLEAADLEAPGPVAMANLMDRLVDVARLLTGRYADIDPALCAELLLHFERGDFIKADIATTRERLPARLRWLLRDDDDDE